ncbi:MAG: hypothetical protein CMD26_06715 [Flavobacteriales bacterium]|nr:hypothetical protein [Flavobacteriales bacterium]|tara:strand:+ start:3495 stop:4220 length:726 start_codon:yes stop_codon:yes gene_type:complete
MLSPKKNLNIALFSYNFPHRKTIDFIDQIYMHGYSISLILAAEAIKIKSPKSFFNFQSKPIKRDIHFYIKKHSIPYYVVKHNSQKTINLLLKYSINFSIISGARILDKSIIENIQYGVLNFHPAILPHIRGLDSLLWSIYKNKPLGVTVHLINHEIDSGYLVCQKKIIISLKDDIYSLKEKIYQLQLDLLPISLNLILKNKKFSKLEKGQYNSKMEYGTQKKLASSILEYIQTQIKHEQEN